MKASELIEKLQKTIQEQGDLEVVTEDSGDIKYSNWYELVTDVRIHKVEPYFDPMSKTFSDHSFKDLGTFESRVKSTGMLTDVETPEPNSVILIS